MVATPSAKVPEGTQQGPDSHSPIQQQLMDPRLPPRVPSELPSTKARLTLPSAGQPGPLQMWCQPRARLLGCDEPLSTRNPPTPTQSGQGPGKAVGYAWGSLEVAQGCSRKCFEKPREGASSSCPRPHLTQGGAEWRQGRGKPKSEPRGGAIMCSLRTGQDSGNYTSHHPTDVRDPQVRCSAARTREGPPARPSALHTAPVSGQSPGPTGPAA